MHRSSHRLWIGVKFALVLVVVLGAGAIIAGRVTLVGTHGTSMNPLYYQGDLVVVAKASSYHIGEIVAYHPVGQSITVLHRIIGGNAAGFVMKGDNNTSIDPTHPIASKVIGHAILHIPDGATWVGRLTSPVVFALGAFLLIMAGGHAVHARRRRKRAPMSHAIARVTLVALPRRVQIVGVVAAVLGLGGALLAALAWTTPSSSLARASTRATDAVTFSYSAAVAASAAYDGTTARSPDPIFRRLANLVRVQVDYQGHPGTMAVNAELASPGGWNATIPLTAAASFTGNQHDAVAVLDLDSLDARAQSAAAVTGLPASPLTVTIEPTVTSAADPVFAPKLTLSLSALQLAVATGPSALVVPDTATVMHTARVSRSLTLFGGHLGIARARLVSVLALLAALLGLGILLALLRRATPIAEDAEIRRRYAPVLAAVEPVVIPANRRMIDVTEFATLAKLAQRCGLLVMHWTRSDVHTYVVLDELTTYRYRTGSISVDANVADPTTHGAVFDPTAHGAVADPTTHGAVFDPTTHGAVADPTAHGAVLDPTTRRGATADVATASPPDPRAV